MMIRLRTTNFGWPLEEIWVAGALLDDVADLDAGSVVLMLDEAADELPWLAVASSGGMGEQSAPVGQATGDVVLPPDGVAAVERETPARRYWEPHWRREHHGEEREDLLWRAASAVTEIEDALDAARTRR